MRNKFIRFFVIFSILFGSIIVVNPNSSHAMDCLGGDRPLCIGGDIVKDIPTSLYYAKLDGYYIDLDKFDTKTEGKYKDRKSGWFVSRDKGNNPHGGSYWKLENRKGNRVATLSQAGKILRE